MEMIAKMGSSPYQDAFRAFSLVGTEDYIAPETLNDTEATYSQDLWSLGVILYQMLSGSTPFKGKNPEATYQNIKEANPDEI